MRVFRGKSVSDEIGMGKIVFFKKQEINVTSGSEANPKEELLRYEQAVEIADSQLQKLYEQCAKAVGERDAAVFEAQRLLLKDGKFVEQVCSIIENQGVSAEFGVRLAGEQIAQMLETVPDEYIKERARDMRDVTVRLLEILTRGVGDSEAVGDKIQEKLPQEPFILVAEDLLPSQTVQFAGTKVQGFALLGGSTGSHVAIFARSMGVPALVQLGEELPGEMAVQPGEQLREKFEQLSGKPAILDGRNGSLYIEPDENICAEMIQRKEEIDGEKKRLQNLKGLENVTTDGRKIKVYANVGSLAEVEQALENDGGGIGLLRSECLYLERDSAPNEETQFEFYKQVLERMGDRQVVIRTFDIGADKQVSYLQQAEEENPALGLRAIRLGLEYPELLKTQLRALYRAGVYGNLHIMYPMITSVEEVHKLKELEREAKAELLNRGERFAEAVPTGIMIETPAAALLSESLANEVDFFSVGTNDLTQYTLALDRRNEAVARFADHKHRAVLKLIELAAQSAHEAGIWIGICGELAADTEFTEEFLRMSIDELSVTPSEILKLRERIREL